MYSVSTREVEAFHDNKEEYDTGIILSIKPPIELNPDVVSSYLTYGFLQQDKKDQGGSSGLHSVQLLGSTEEATSIYIGSMVDHVEGVMNEVEQSAVELISLLGSTAIIVEQLRTSSTRGSQA